MALYKLYEVWCAVWCPLAIEVMGSHGSVKNGLVVKSSFRSRLIEIFFSNLHEK